MTGQREQPPREAAPRRASDEALAELPLAHTLIALHRAEQAPRVVRERVESRLQAPRAPRSGRAAWAHRLHVFMAQIAGWPGAGAVAVAALLLLTWQQRRADEARESQSTEPGPTPLAEPEATVSGLAVPGSLQWRMYGDEMGMGHCEAHFLLTPDGAAHDEPIRVHWTRCDLPDTLSAELSRIVSPARGAQPLSLSARGHWLRKNDFDALGLRLQQ